MREMQTDDPGQHILPIHLHPRTYANTMQIYGLLAAIRPNQRP